MNILAFKGMINLKNKTPLKITLIYLLIGSLWILFSDFILLSLIPQFEGQESNSSLNVLTTYQTFKGWFFVIMTSALLFLLIQTSYKKQSRYLEKVKSLEIHHAEILKNMPVGIYRTDTYGNITYINQRASNIFGPTYHLNHKTTLSKSIFGRSERLEKRWEKAFKNRTVFYEEYEFSSPGNGEKVYVLEFAYPMQNINGHFSGYIGTLIDNTALRDAYRKVHEIKERLDIAIRAGDIGLWDWDIKTDKVYFSPEWKMQLGYREDEISDDFSEWESRLHPEDKQKAINAVSDFFKNPEQGYRNEFRLRHKDGSFRWILVRAELQYDNKGQPLRVVGTHVDISHIKQAELNQIQSQHRLHTILEASPTILYVLEVDDNNAVLPSYASSNIEKILGFTREEAMEKNWWRENLHPEDSEEAENFFSDLMNTDTRNSTYRFYDKEGKIHWIRDFSRLVTTTVNGAEKREIIGLFTDFTSEHETQETQEVLNTVFSNMYDGVLITDARGTIVSCNPSFEATFSCKEDGICGENIDVFSADPRRDKFFDQLIRTMNDRNYWTGYTWCTTSDISHIPFWLSVTRIVNNVGLTEKLLFIFKDVSEINAKEAELSKLAHYDPLTGLPNRNKCEAMLESFIRQVLRRGNKLALFYMDLDDFKNINDSLGYQAGNEVLIQVSESLKTLLGENASLARIGGDEFLFLLESNDPEIDADELAKQVMKVLHEPIQLSGMQNVYIDTSIGISIFPDHGNTSAILVQRANLSMNLAKKAGKHQHRLFTEEMEVAANDQLNLLTALRESIKREDFSVYYQPKISIEDNKYTGAEALIRWQDSDGNLISPGMFIPLAETSGMIIDIGCIVIDKVIAQIAEWIKRDIDPGMVSINISARQFRDKQLVSHFRYALKENPVPTEKIAIEITESALMIDPEGAAVTIKEFRDMGIEIHLDDFGTGYSSFAYISRFMPDVMKLDMTFVQKINQSDTDNQILISMLDIAHNLGIKTVAEGVEEDEHLNFLRTHRCDEYQGYLFSPPLPVKEFEKRNFTSQDN